MSMNLIGENVEQLKRLFPEAVTEGKIDFEVLKALLGGEIETRQEYYKFTWNGKEAARAYARTRSMGTLRPCVEESSGKDGTPGKFDSENLYIEGDNLEVLKLLQGAYHKKVKMIYIDPPYNTGKDFVYPDNYRNPIGEYKALTGQTDAEGKSTRANPETSGRYHTDWLNMMYPRLSVAYKMLADDGVLFMSIDDNELANARKLLDEVFGENNFIATFPRLSTKSGKTPLTFMISHDYVVCYVKSEYNIFIGKEYEDDSYKYEDEFIDSRGRYNLKQPLDCNSISYSPSLDYEIVHEGITYYPGGSKEKFEERKAGLVSPKDWAWRWSKELFEFGRKNGWIVFQNGRIYTKGYLRATIGNDHNGYTIIYREKTRKLSTIDFIDNAFSNDIAKKQLANLGLSSYFDYPKATTLLKILLESYFQKDAIALDFFSGSASTAHAMMQLNAEDGGNRKFIMVQLPEPCEEGTEAAKAGYKNICEIGKERIRRAARKVVSDKWEVISVEEKARYGCKELSRADCLAKINESGENDLFAGEKVAEGGTLCAVGSNAAGSGINSIQHSGRTGEELNEGISPISGNRTGQQGGAGNATASLRSSELPCPYGHFGSDATTSGSRENASCPYKNTDHCPLTTKYCSDMGFKVFKLDTSNLLPWNPNAETLAQDLYKAVDNVLADRSTDDLLYEILLKCNLPLTLPIEKKQFGGNTVYIVGMGALAICLDKPIPATIADEIVKLRDEYAPIVPMQVVFRDNGFDDVSKTNALQILKQAGFEDKSIQTI